MRLVDRQLDASTELLVAKVVGVELVELATA